MRECAHFLFIIVCKHWSGAPDLESYGSYKTARQKVEMGWCVLSWKWWPTIYSRRPRAYMFPGANKRFWSRFSANYFEPFHQPFLLRRVEAHVSRKQTTRRASSTRSWPPRKQKLRAICENRLQQQYQKWTKLSKFKVLSVLFDGMVCRLSYIYSRTVWCRHSHVVTSKYIDPNRTPE